MMNLTKKNHNVPDNLNKNFPASKRPWNRSGHKINQIDQNWNGKKNFNKRFNKNFNKNSNKKFAHRRKFRKFNRFLVRKFKRTQFMKRMGAVHTSKFRRKVKKIKIALAGIKLSSHRDNFNKGRRFTKRLVFKKNRRIYSIRVKSRYRFNVPNRLTARLHYRFKVARYVRKAKVYTCIYKSFTRKFSKIRPVYFKFRQRLMCKRRSFRPWYQFGGRRHWQPQRHWKSHRKPFNRFNSRFKRGFRQSLSPALTARKLVKQLKNKIRVLARPDLKSYQRLYWFSYSRTTRAMAVKVAKYCHRKYFGYKKKSRYSQRKRLVLAPKRRKSLKLQRRKLSKPAWGGVRCVVNSFFAKRRKYYQKRINRAWKVLQTLSRSTFNPSRTVRNKKLKRRAWYLLKRILAKANRRYICVFHPRIPKKAIVRRRGNNRSRNKVQKQERIPLQHQKGPLASVELNKERSRIQYALRQQRKEFRRNNPNWKNLQKRNNKFQNRSNFGNHGNFQNYGRQFGFNNNRGWQNGFHKRGNRYRGRRPKIMPLIVRMKKTGKYIMLIIKGDRKILRPLKLRDTLPPGSWWKVRLGRSKFRKIRCNSVRYSSRFLSRTRTKFDYSFRKITKIYKFDRRVSKYLCWFFIDGRFKSTNSSLSRLYATSLKAINNGNFFGFRTHRALQWGQIFAKKNFFKSQLRTYLVSSSMRRNGICFGQMVASKYLPTKFIDSPKTEVFNRFHRVLGWRRKYGSTFTHNFSKYVWSRAKSPVTSKNTFTGNVKNNLRIRSYLSIRYNQLV